MKAKARKALGVIRDCVDAGRYLVLKHFTRQMDRRGLFRPDIQAAICSPSDVRDDGADRFARPRWIVRGKATDGLEIGIVCVLDVDDRGVVTVFITAYWSED